MQPTPVFLPGKPHGWRSLVGYYSPWGHKESDTTERTHSLSISLSFSRGSSQHKDQTPISYIDGGFFTIPFNKLINASKCFPEFCELVKQINQT